MVSERDQGESATGPVPLDVNASQQSLGFRVEYSI
jgi:hypothetical protein